MNPQLKLVESLTQWPSLQSSDPDSHEFHNINEFNHDADFGHNSQVWFIRWGDLFRRNYTQQGDFFTSKTTLVEADNKYPTFVVYASETHHLKSCRSIQKSSVILHHYSVLDIDIWKLSSMVTPDDLVNRRCERFTLHSFINNQFKCFILISELQSRYNPEICTRLPALVDKDENWKYPMA